METSAAAVVAAAAGGRTDILFARALRPSPSLRLPAAAARQPWDILSSVTELDVRFILGN